MPFQNWIENLSFTFSVYSVFLSHKTFQGWAFVVLLKNEARSQRCAVKHLFSFSSHVSFNIMNVLLFYNFIELSSAPLLQNKNSYNGVRIYIECWNVSKVFLKIIVFLCLVLHRCYMTHVHPDNCMDDALNIWVKIKSSA